MSADGTRSCRPFSAVEDSLRMGPRPDEARPDEVPRRAPDETPAFFDKPRNVRRVIRGLFVICGLMVLLDLFYDKHVDFGAQAIFGFYAAYGYVSCVTLVLVAKGLRKLVMRPEDYYDR